MLAVAGKLPADDEDWAFEIKWDGVRAILFVEGGRVRAQSRNDLDVTVSFPELADIGQFLGMTTCIIDGEIVALGEDGRPSFSRLQQRMHVSNQREAKRRSLSDPVTFVAFDLLYLDGHSLVGHTYDERRERLESLHLSGETFTTTDSFRDVSGQDILNATVENGLEGVVAKRRASPYRPGRRNPDWTKVKYFRTQEVVVGAWTDGRGERQDSLGALLLGIPDERRAALRRQGRDRLQRRHAQRLARRPPGPGDAGQPVRLRAPGRRCGGGALRAPRAGGRGRVRRVDDGGQAAPTHAGAVCAPTSHPHDVVVE